MKICGKCGKQVEDTAESCPQCLVRFAPRPKPVYTPSADASSKMMALIGFFFPIFGILLYFCLKAENPLKAHSALNGAIVALKVAVVLILVALIAVAAYFAVQLLIYLFS